MNGVSVFLPVGWDGLYTCLSLKRIIKEDKFFFFVVVEEKFAILSTIYLVRKKVNSTGRFTFYFLWRKKFKRCHFPPFL